MDVRLQKRYVRLVMQHMNAATQLAAGIRGLPAVGNSFAATQAAWRFFSNSRVSLPALAEPLRELGCRAIGQSASDYALLVHDWSKVDYDGHVSKTDQLQLSNSLDRGYELMTALLVDASTGSPLAPMELSLLASDGRHSTGSGRPQRSLPHLRAIAPDDASQSLLEHPAAAGPCDRPRSGFGASLSSVGAEGASVPGPRG